MGCRCHGVTQQVQVAVVDTNLVQQGTTILSIRSFCCADGLAGRRWSPAGVEFPVISAAREASLQIPAACDDRRADRVYALRCLDSAQRVVLDMDSTRFRCTPRTSS